TKLDIISCRNMLIYMEPVLQKKIMALFHYSLNIDGIMLLGSAESKNSTDLNFTVIDSKLKFHKRSVTSTLTELVDFPSAYTSKKAELVVVLKSENSNENIQLLANEYLQQYFSPASLLINPDGDILFISGKTGKYLEPAAGKANLNIFAMAREGLGTPLIGAIRRAKQNYEPQILHGVKVGPKNNSTYVTVTVQHIEKPNAIKGNLMVVFNESNFSVKSERKPITSKNATANLREQELEYELLMANEDLQCAREEMQATQEELKSTNEELQSSNEEMQSTNEKL
ncbi:MAG: chemotaxis protein CheB, partial [Bacteroidetes bacterium]|nr:chemotaxis protein CheB [Bacteroidota bacterium]